MIISSKGPEYFGDIIDGKMLIGSKFIFSTCFASFLLLLLYSYLFNWEEPYSYTFVLMVWNGTIVGSSIFGKHVVVTVIFLLDYSRKKIGQMTVLRELGLLTGMTRSTF